MESLGLPLDSRYNGVMAQETNTSLVLNPVHISERTMNNDNVCPDCGTELEWSYDMWDGWYLNQCTCVPPVPVASIVVTVSPAAAGLAEGAILTTDDYAEITGADQVDSGTYRIHAIIPASAIERVADKVGLIGFDRTEYADTRAWDGSQWAIVPTAYGQV